MRAASHPMRGVVAQLRPWQHWRGYSTGTAQLQVLVEPLSGADEGISVLSLNRPEARNALGRQLMRELGEALDTLRQERSTRVVVLRSLVGGVFCAGADLKERATMTQSETGEFVSLLRRTFGDLAALPTPVIAAVEGAALGGGAEMALACDIRVADAAGATFAFPEARLGIMPGAGGTQRLPRVVGRSAAKALVFTGRRVDAGEAQRLGLVDVLADQGAGYLRALELARDMAQCAPLSLRMAKAAINQGADVGLDSGLRIEESLYAQLIPTRDRLEGLAAFAEKRRPAFTGE